MQGNKAVVQGLERQLAEQQTKSDDELAAQLSKIDVLQQSLAAKSEQHDRLAEDYKNALKVCFHIVYLLVDCDDNLCCRPCLCYDGAWHVVSCCMSCEPLVVLAYSTCMKQLDSKCAAVELLSWSIP